MTTIQREPPPTLPAYAQSAMEFSIPLGACASAVYQPHCRTLRHGLTEAQLAQYHDLGYVILRGVFSRAEAADWDRACNELLSRAELAHPGNLRLALCKDPATGTERVWKFDPFVDLSPALSALARDRRILDPLASIYAGREPRLFKDKLIYKPPGGQGNELHQDYNWWQGFPTSLISVLVAIDPANRTNGCTELFPGHERGLLHAPGAFDGLPAERVDMTRGASIETQPGDIALFNCFVPHRAGPNLSATWRRQIFFTYNDSTDGEHYAAHREHYLWYVSQRLTPEVKARKFFL